MKLRTIQNQPTLIKTGLLMVACFEDETTAGAVPLSFTDRCNDSLGGAMLRQAQVEKFTGANGQTMVHFVDGRLGAERVLLFGLGARDKYDVTALRSALTAGFKAAKALKATDVCVVTQSARHNLSAREVAENIAAYAGMVDYVINHQKTEKGGHKKEARLQVVKVATKAEFDQEVRAGLASGRAIAEAVNLSRDLSNMPAGELTPRRLAKFAQIVARNSGGAITCKVFGKVELKKMGANALLAVSQGSVQEPVLIEMNYTPEGGPTKEVLGYVGKSITFDSGGLDIKTADGMRTMKRDMAGGGSVLGAIGAIAALKLPISIKVVMAATENMLGGGAYKPGDVIHTMNGRSVEVDNTDAEGRLSLADAIEFAKLNGVTKIIDLATLTGAIRSYGGDVGAGAFGNTPEYTAKVLQAAAAAGERMGELPMWPELRAANHTDMADLKNSGGDPGSVTAAWFIREFAGDVPWVHLDIAGCSYRNRELGPDPKGATGYGVRTLIELARIFAA